MLKLDMSRRTALPNLNQNHTHDLIKGTMSFSSLIFLCPLPANIGVDVNLVFQVVDPLEEVMHKCFWVYLLNLAV